MCLSLPAFHVIWGRVKLCGPANLVSRTDAPACVIWEAQVRAFCSCTGRGGLIHVCSLRTCLICLFIHTAVFPGSTWANAEFFARHHTCGVCRNLPEANLTWYLESTVSLAATLLCVIDLVWSI
ncbi:hypothetical protein mRhiFer1_008396 [Rhinolophus ferrumequinum]|uniref:Uncharacterized protein n=1 Tax=Rhinolophus ferrumequinum TaxID=59479 RepID=A0A7J7VE65_RHIFE|nr:hypothetical protein mRhiFer1_008396 [Rhinolophus ferrumequinum]